MTTPRQAGLVRAIGRWTLVALVINSIIGSGIFGLPDDVARLVGAAAPFAYLLAALGMGVIMACFAEVASQFTAAGGPYLYAHKAFGSLVGIQTGWFAWLVRLTSAAANANLFVVYFGEFLPAATDPVPRAALLTALIGVLAYVNVRGVKSGANLSNVFTVTKLVPLAIFIFVGLTLVGSRIQVGPSGASGTDWMQAVLALIFAYGGFESALMPMGEAKEPRRDAPFALFAALVAVTLVYLLVHLVVMGAITDASAFDRPEVRERPVAEAARVFLGAGGAILIVIGVLISTYGYLAGQFVSAPRLTYAFAEQRDFPALFAAVHPRFRTPYVSIAVYALLVWALAIYGSFIWNAILSAVARLFAYAAVCAAVIRLRRTQPDAAAFRLPAGWLFALAGIGFCVLMVTQMGRQHLMIVAVVAAAAFANWLWARRKV